MAINEGFINMDLYEFLGCLPSAQDHEIRKAFRQKSLTCHPDKHPNNPEAAEMFTNLKSVVDLLTDKNKRAYYDRKRFDIWLEHTLEAYSEEESKERKHSAEPKVGRDFEQRRDSIPIQQQREMEKEEARKMDEASNKSPQSASKKLFDESEQKSHKRKKKGKLPEEKNATVNGFITKLEKKFEALTKEKEKRAADKMQKKIKRQKEMNSEILKNDLDWRSKFKDLEKSHNAEVGDFKSQIITLRAKLKKSEVELIKMSKALTKNMMEAAKEQEKIKRQMEIQIDDSKNYQDLQIQRWKSKFADLQKFHCAEVGKLRSQINVLHTKHKTSDVQRLIMIAVANKMEEAEKEQKQIKRQMEMNFEDSKNDLELQIEQWRSKFQELEKSRRSKVGDMKSQIESLHTKLRILKIQRLIMEISHLFGDSDAETYGSLMYKLAKKPIVQLFHCVCNFYLTYVNFGAFSRNFIG